VCAKRRPKKQQTLLETCVFTRSAAKVGSIYWESTCLKHCWTLHLTVISELGTAIGSQTVKAQKSLWIMRQELHYLPAS